MVFAMAAEVRYKFDWLWYVFRVAYSKTRKITRTVLKYFPYQKLYYVRTVEDNFICLDVLAKPTQQVPERPHPVHGIQGWDAE